MTVAKPKMCKVEHTEVDFGVMGNQMYVLTLACGRRVKRVRCGIGGKGMKKSPKRVECDCKKQEAI